MSTIDYSDKIPNNVNLSGDRTLQRALEQWQPNFLNCWDDMGPEGSTSSDVYLRTAVSVDPQGWAQFGHVKMRDSVEQQRHLGLTAPSQYDLRNPYQIAGAA